MRVCFVLYQLQDAVLSRDNDAYGGVFLSPFGSAIWHQSGGIKAQL